MFNDLGEAIRNVSKKRDPFMLVVMGAFILAGAALGLAAGFAAGGYYNKQSEPANAELANAEAVELSPACEPVSDGLCAEHRLRILCRSLYLNFHGTQYLDTGQSYYAFENHQRGCKDVLSDRARMKLNEWIAGKAAQGKTTVGLTEVRIVNKGE